MFEEGEFRMIWIVYSKLDDPEGDKNVGPEGLAVKKTLSVDSRIFLLKTLL